MGAIFKEVDKATRNLLSLLTGNNVIEISISRKFNFTKLARDSRLLKISTYTLKLGT